MPVSPTQLHRLRETPLPIRWRVQEFAKKPANPGNRKPYAVCIAYSNTQDVQDFLDNMIGAENWQVKHDTVGNGMIVTYIGINIEGVGWVFKGDTGSPGSAPNKSEGDKNKSLLSDSFKRAAVLFGIGRYNYFMPRINVTASKWKEEGYPQVVDDNNKTVYNLTEYISNNYKKKIEEALKNYQDCAIDPDDARAEFLDSESVADISFKRATLEALLEETPKWDWTTVAKFIKEKFSTSLAFDEITPEQQDVVIDAVSTYRETIKKKGQKNDSNSSETPPAEGS